APALVEEPLPSCPACGPPFPLPLPLLPCPPRGPPFPLPLPLLSCPPPCGPPFPLPLPFPLPFPPALASAEETPFQSDCRKDGPRIRMAATATATARRETAAKVEATYPIIGRHRPLWFNSHSSGFRPRVVNVALIFIRYSTWHRKQARALAGAI